MKNDMQKKIEVSELVSEIKRVLQDEFVAEVRNTEENLILRFINGQKFKIHIEEE